LNDSSLLSKEVKALVSVYIPYVMSISDNFKCIGNLYNIRTIFRTKHTPRSSLMRTRPERNQHMAQRVYGIPYECGRSYNGETSRPLAM
jgi:hypothetical protein